MADAHMKVADRRARLWRSMEGGLGSGLGGQGRAGQRPRPGPGRGEGEGGREEGRKREEGRHGKARQPTLIS